ncbi:hypothetical protein [Actinomadura yumaensis]|uniref:Uncharacterized protein n=1 Tax=Actinomadura yumaensis TaxID=111807 RepID=A0ABW2CP23_9ACTN
MTLVTAPAAPTTIGELRDGDLVRFDADGRTTRVDRITRHAPDNWVPFEHCVVNYTGNISGTWINVPLDTPVWLVARLGDAPPVSLLKPRYARPIVVGDLVVERYGPYTFPARVVEVTDVCNKPCLTLSNGVLIRPDNVVLVRA